MEIDHGCFHFRESDVFIYLEGKEDIYLAFTDELLKIREVTERESSMAGSGNIQERMTVEEDRVLQSDKVLLKEGGVGSGKKIHKEL